MKRTILDFREYLSRVNALRVGSNMIMWDMLTGAPKGGNTSMGKYAAALSAEEFALMVSSEMGNFLQRLEKDHDNLDEITKAMFRICKKFYDSNKSIPVAEMRSFNELANKSQMVWEESKHEDNYKKFAPYLDEIIKYKRKFVAYRGFSGANYNTLLDDFEPNMDINKLDVFFDKVKNTIVPLLKKVQNSSKKIDTSFTKRPVSIDKQRKIASLIMEKVGYDLNHGMLKEAEHPFSVSFGRNDNRITTHYHEDNLMSSLFCVLHEAGHAIYEHNKMVEIEDTILDDGISNGIHESQSRFYENVIGRSYEFWELIYDDLMGILGDDFKDISLIQWYEAANAVEPGLIRIEADELTYSLHILIRYEIEKMLISGAYDINELPNVWNNKYIEYLGISSDIDSKGILQDVHWSDGSFGYFPSYSLGNAYAAQLLFYIQKDIEVFKCIKEGNISDITQWLKEKIHKYGSLKTPDQLIKNIAGEELNAEYYMDYLTNKFTKLYDI